MALIACPECNKEVSDSSKCCPNCGYKLSRDKIKNMFKSNEKLHTLFFVLSFFIIVGTFLLFVCNWVLDSSREKTDIIKYAIGSSLRISASLYYSNLEYDSYVLSPGITEISDSEFEASGHLYLRTSVRGNRYETTFDCTCTYSEEETDANCNCKLGENASRIID